MMPETQTKQISEVQRQLDALVNDVSHQESRVLIEKNGTPVAALVSPDDLRRLERFEQEREADFAIIDEVREAFKDVPPEELEREAAKAINEVRAEMRAEREHHPVRQ